MGKTVITGSANVGQPGMTTYNSATVGEFGAVFFFFNKNWNFTLYLYHA